MAWKAKLLGRKAADLAAYLAVRVAVCLAQALSPEACQWWAKVLAWLVGGQLGLRGGVVEENLRLAFPTWTARERRLWAMKMWEHLFQMFFEIAQAPLRLHVVNWRRYVEIEDITAFVEFLLARRPKLLVSGHFGNFELGGYVAGLLGFPTYTIARPLDNAWLDRFVQRFRTRTGQVLLPKQGSMAAVERIVAAGGIVAVLGDQYAGPKGCWVEFFGRPASSHKAIALFSLAHRAPMGIVAVVRDGTFLRLRIRLLEVIDPQRLAPDQRDVSAITQRYHQRLEEAIRQAPEQYWWVHRRWKGAPPHAARRQPTAA